MNSWPCNSMNLCIINWTLFSAIVRPCQKCSWVWRSSYSDDVLTVVQVAISVQCSSSTKTKHPMNGSHCYQQRSSNRCSNVSFTEINGTWTKRSDCCWVFRLFVCFHVRGQWHWPGQCFVRTNWFCRGQRRYYVAGFVVQKCKKLVMCQTCISQLTSTHVDESYTLLINVKLRGALNWPCKVLFSSLLIIENTVSAYINNLLSPFMFTTIIKEALPSMLPIRSVLCPSHASSLTAEILVYYISTRLHWHAKILNDYASRKKAE